MGKNLTATLKNLKSLPVNEFHPSLWIVKRSLRALTANYDVASVKIERKLQTRLKNIVVANLASANHVEPYEYLSADQEEDMALTLDLSETDLAAIAEQIANGSDNSRIEEPRDLFDSWAYIIEMRKKEQTILALRKISDGWKLKQKEKFLATVFRNGVLVDYEDEDVFRLERRLDCIAFDESVFILDKKQFEAALNFRAGMEQNRDELLDEFNKADLVTDVEILRAKVGTKLSYLRKISMIKKNGYYKEKTFINGVRIVAKEKGWDVPFDGDRIVITETNVDLVLTLLNNDRLESLINHEIFDVDVKIRVN
jgi:hypothetical protein